MMRILTYRPVKLIIGKMVWAPLFGSSPNIRWSSSHFHYSFSPLSGHPINELWFLAVFHFRGWSGVTHVVANIVSEIRWQHCISDAGPSFNFRHKLRYLCFPLTWKLTQNMIYWLILGLTWKLTPRNQQFHQGPILLTWFNIIQHG